MGCGQSSLKGEKTEDVQEPAKPLKKVATNFSTVNYDAEPSNARRRSELPPHQAHADEIQQHRPSEALSPGTEKPTNPLSIAAVTNPAESTQPAVTTADNSTTFENKLPTQTPQNPLGEEVTKTEPYKDVTASPQTPTAPNVAAAFPEATHADKPAVTAQ